MELLKSKSIQWGWTENSRKNTFVMMKDPGTKQESLEQSTLTTTKTE